MHWTCQTTFGLYIIPLLLLSQSSIVSQSFTFVEQKRFVIKSSLQILSTTNNASMVDSTRNDNDDNNDNIGALMRSRLLSSETITSSSFRLEHDNSEQQQTDDIHNVIRVKTLIWEVLYSNDTQRNKAYIVTALGINDKVSVGCLENLVRKSYSCSCPSLKICISLAPREVAEDLTGYESGTMAPICHTTPMPLYIDESIIRERRTKNTTIVSVGCGTMGHSLFLKLDDMMKIAETIGDTVKLGEFIYQDDTTKRVLISDTNDAITSRDAASSQSDVAIKPRKKGFTQLAPKDRLTEYRMLPSIRQRSQLLRTTARKKGRFEEMQRLVHEAVTTGEFNDVMYVGPNGDPAKNALHFAAWKGDYETIVLLVETSKQHRNLDNIINRISTGPGSYGKSPIFYALTQCRDDVVIYLLSQGVSLLLVNNKGQTPCSVSVSHLKPETCEIMYKMEAQELKDGGTFINYRESHSDDKLYGDLDPRFPIDEHNMGDDIHEQCAAFHESIAKTELHGGFPKTFNPRSIRPTTRWWNRNDTSLEATNLNISNLNRLGKMTLTQSSKITTNSYTSKENRIPQVQNVLQPKVPEDDLNLLERLTLKSVIMKDPKGILPYSLATTVQDISGIQILLKVIDHTIESINQEKVDKCCPQGSFVKHAWGIDCEWKPGQDFGKNNPVATLQLSTRSNAFLVDLQTLCRTSISDEKDTLTEPEALLSQVLTKLFADLDIALLGFGILQDLDKLAASFPHLECFTLFNSVVDLQAISNHTVFKESKQHSNSLQKTVVNLVGMFLDKSEQCSDWTKRPLTDKQVEYATLDAAVLPYLLKKLLEEPLLEQIYHGKFFEKHSNLRLSYRYSYLDRKIEVSNLEKSKMAYSVPCGRVKVCMSKTIARQSWSSGSVAPELPKLIESVCKVQPNRSLECHEGKDKIDGRRRINKKKMRPPPIPLSMIAGALDNLPLPGVCIGYTKESCVYSVLGDYMKLIPSTTYIGFNRRSGVVEASNAWVLFVNFFVANKAGYCNEFLEDGKQLMFTVKKPKRAIEQGMIQYLIEQCENGNLDRRKKVLLFARPSTRSKYVFCGECRCNEMTEYVSGSMDLLLDLINFDEFIEEQDFKTVFTNTI